MRNGHEPLSAPQRQAVFESIAAIGVRKLIGYLPIYTLRDFLRVDPADVAADAMARGLRSMLFGAEDCCIKSGALYVYDPDGLRRLLRLHAAALAAAGYSDEPEAFVRQIAAVWVGPLDPVHGVIEEAFGD